MCTTSPGLEFGHAQILSGVGCIHVDWPQDERPWYTSALVILRDLTRRKGQVSGEQLCSHPMRAPPCRSDIGEPCCAELCGHTTSVLRSFDQTTRDKARPRNCIVPESASGGLGADGTMASHIIWMAFVHCVSRCKVRQLRHEMPTKPPGSCRGNRSSPSRRCGQRDGSLQGHDMG